MVEEQEKPIESNTKRESIPQTEPAVLEDPIDPKLSIEEIEQQIEDIMGTAPAAEEKQNVHSFLFNVVKAKDTTKLGNLKEEEVGVPRLPIRTYQELALFCRKVGNMNYFHDYFMAKSEIMTSTSLSKDAKLINLAVVNKKEIADVSSPAVENKGWFKKKEKPAAF